MMMEIHNYGLYVGNVEIDAISSSSIFLIGDNDSIVLSSFFDTPLESYPDPTLVPLAPQA